MAAPKVGALSDFGLDLTAPTFWAVEKGYGRNTAIAIRAIAAVPPLLTADLLEIGAGCGHYEFLGDCVQNGLLHIARAVGKEGHLNLQVHDILGLTHVGVDGHGDDR